MIVALSPSVAPKLAAMQVCSMSSAFEWGALGKCAAHSGVIARASASRTIPGTVFAVAKGTVAARATLAASATAKAKSDDGNHTLDAEEARNPGGNQGEQPYQEHQRGRSRYRDEEGHDKKFG